MNKVLSIINNIEIDFKSNDEKFNSFLQLGSSYFAGNEFPKALNIFEKAIEENPKNPGGWIGKAFTHLAMTELSEINSVNINNYVERAISNSEIGKMEKYLESITLFYGYQFAGAIRLYINQTNQAIVEKKKAQVAAVIGLATAVAGGAIANKSKSFSGTFVGYSMLAGGAGVTIKKGYDSFSLDQLAKSLYGNALAQTIISISAIKECHEIYTKSSGVKKENIEEILNSWKESVIFLFRKEKESFIQLLNELVKTSNLIEKDKILEFQNKIDEILYFMDVIGLDNSSDVNKLKDIKNIINEMINSYGSEKLETIAKKRKNLLFITILVTFGILALLQNISEKNLPNDSPIPGILIIGIIYLSYRYYKSKSKSINNKYGLSEIQNNLTSISKKLNEINITLNEIDMKLIGI